jgi:hypothetical protein
MPENPFLVRVKIAFFGMVLRGIGGLGAEPQLLKLLGLIEKLYLIYSL